MKWSGLGKGFRSRSADMKSIVSGTHSIIRACCGCVSFNCSYYCIMWIWQSPVEGLSSLTLEWDEIKERVFRVCWQTYREDRPAWSSSNCRSRWGCSEPQSCSPPHSESPETSQKAWEQSVNVVISARILAIDRPDKKMDQQHAFFAYH